MPMSNELTAKREDNACAFESSDITRDSLSGVEAVALSVGLCLVIRLTLEL